MAASRVLKIQDLTPEAMLGRCFAGLASQNHVLPHLRLLNQVYQLFRDNEMTPGEHDGGINEGRVKLYDHSVQVLSDVFEMLRDMNKFTNGKKTNPLASVKEAGPSGKAHEKQGKGAVDKALEVTKKGNLVDPGNKKQTDDKKVTSGRVGRKRRPRGGVKERARKDKKKAARESAVRD